MSLGIGLRGRESAGSSILFVKGTKIFTGSGLNNDISSWKTTSRDFTKGLLDGLWNQYCFAVCVYPTNTNFSAVGLDFLS